VGVLPATGRAAERGPAAASPAAAAASEFGSVTESSAAAAAARSGSAAEFLADSLAEHARLASRSLLLAIAAAGQRLVTVGERGHVLLSDDRGATWTQAEVVPTRALLTGVCFSDSQRGVAVGHDEVILTTHDAGRTWTLTHFAPQAQQPLLDVACADGGRVIAVGAYGVYFTSTDGGASWKEGKFTASAANVSALAASVGPGAPKVAAGAAADARRGASAEGPVDGGRDYHLNKIVAASAARLYIAAEGGHLYRSDDTGETWHELPSPYDGSFFGMKPLGGDVVLAYGLRGNLFRSEDAGATWRKVETGTHAMLNDAVSGDPGGLTAAVGLSGVVLVSHDAGKSFALMQQEDRKGLSAALAVSADTLVVVGEGGARLIEIAPAAAQVK
jgi:photosystem II stability/assembly factor-like uncharacterized protein